MQRCERVIQISYYKFPVNFESSTFFVVSLVHKDSVLCQS